MLAWIKRIAGYFLYWTLAIGFVVAAMELGSYEIWSGYLKTQVSNGVFRVNTILGQDTSQTLVSNPYSLYWNNPAFTDEYGRQYDDGGYRSPPYQPRDNELRILALGGSTTNVYPYIKDRSKIWTSLLAESLSKSLNRPVHVFNAGLPYGTSAELMIHFLLKGKYLKPHVVIFHEGGNDVAPLLFPGYQTDYSHFRQSSNGPARPYEKELLHWSYTARVFYAFWLKDGGGSLYRPAGTVRSARPSGGITPRSG